MANNIVVAYFSATGATRKVAEALAHEAHTDIIEIAPATPYTAADLDWHNKQSRSSVEMSDAASRPALAKAPGDLSAYDTVLLGFPIWWYVAPRIISTWVEAADLAGKRVVVWATSGGSGLGNSAAELKKLAPQASWEDGKVFHGTAGIPAFVNKL